MTYKQIIVLLQTTLESHAMLYQVKNVLPSEWINDNTEAQFRIACFTVRAGNFNKGEDVFNVDLYVLDQTGVDKEFETEVISDCVGVARGIVHILRDGRQDFSMPDTVLFNTIADYRYENGLAGCVVTFEITTQNIFDKCDEPLK